MYVRTDSYAKCGCVLNLTSLPEESVVIDVDALIRHDGQVRGVVGGDMRCDLAVFTIRNGEGAVLLIEATTTRSKPSRKLRRALQQLGDSFDNLGSLMQSCSIQTPTLNQYAVIVSKKVGRNTTNNQTAESEQQDFEDNHNANVRIVRCSDDIWAQI